MQRRVFICGLVGAAFSGTSAYASGFEKSIVAELRAQGFGQIDVETTWLGRLRITAKRRGVGREIVLNPRTGEILRDIRIRKDGSISPRDSESDDRTRSGTSGSDDDADDGDDDGGDDDSGKDDSQDDDDAGDDRDED